MDVIGGDREAARLADHVALPRQQREGHDNRRHRNTDPLGCGLHPRAGQELLDGAAGDPERRDRDQDDLEQRGDGLCLAVAEAMLVVRRLRGDPHAQQRRQAGNQIEYGVGKAAEHRCRAGRPRRPALDRQQQRRRRDTGDGRTAVEMPVVHAHG